MAQPTVSVTVTATLNDSAGNPLPNETISFSHKLSTDTTFTNDGTATTDANGNASVTLTLNAPASYDFMAAFAGDSNYLPSSATLTAIVIKAPTAITIVVS